MLRQVRCVRRLKSCGGPPFRRGLCGRCYAKYRRAVAAGLLTWAELEKRRWALKKRQGRRR